MKAGLFVVLLTVLHSYGSSAQDKCASASYLQSSLQNDATLADKINTAENFIRDYKKDVNTLSRIESTVIKIPVVVHILYHTPEEKVSDAQVKSQIEALNKYFRRRNSDTANTPAYFRALAADCEIEFQLATTAPGKKFSNGITRKYTPVTKWGADDKMKFAAEMGADAWDAKNYLNIWVCNLDKFAGYASIPGTDADKDGIVISYKAFGTTGTVQSGYALGKTAVHEVGHWLGLKHIWGDANCGDDEVSDTPKQASYTPGCPTTVRVTCGNSPYGDMYMNYMDLTNDYCVNMFTLGQKERMRTLFATEGFRNSILSTNAFLLPQTEAIPVADDDPKWLEPRLYPNPANNELNLDLAYDIRWIGKKIFVTNILGQNVMNVEITSKKSRIDVSKLKAGLYFLAAKKEDGVSLKMKFIKL
jgi:Pregnancy-associated plasma protein-A/Secretion system C-terminal sorting domain